MLAIHELANLFLSSYSVYSEFNSYLCNTQVGQPFINSRDTRWSVSSIQVSQHTVLTISYSPIIIPFVLETSHHSWEYSNSLSKGLNYTDSHRAAAIINAHVNITGQWLG